MKWISTENESPDHKNEVLIYCDGMMGVASFWPLTNLWVIGDVRFKSGSKVKYWQELPEPPAAEILGEYV